MTQPLIGSTEAPVRAIPVTRSVVEARSDESLRTIVGLALVIGVFGRLVAGWQAPLWLDETFTATIASQNSAKGLFDWLLHELSGPAFYLPQWAWAQLAGESNVAQRIPSVVYSLAAPALVLWRGHPDRRTRMIWAAVLALWPLGCAHATEARPYALLVLIATAQAITFHRLLADVTLPRACFWVAISGIGVLTHYYMIVIATVQGLLLLASAPRAALRSWPALLLLLPVFAWMSVHLPAVLAFASGSTWYNYVIVAWLRQLPNAVFGFWPFSEALAVGMVGTAALAGLPKLAAPTPVPPRVRADALLILSGLATIAIVVGWAMFNRSFTPRYLLLFAPPVLFGVACWLNWLDSHLRPRYSAVVLLLLCVSTTVQLVARFNHPENDIRSALSFERASDWLRERGATRRLIFFWDNPTADSANRALIAEVGGYFLRRAGDHPEVVLPAMPRAVDPNTRLLAMAGADRGAGILWLYDTAVPHTRGRRFPHRIDAIDPRWRCHDFGRGNITVLACAAR